MKNILKKLKHLISKKDDPPPIPDESIEDSPLYNEIVSNFPKFPLIEAQILTGLTGLLVRLAMSDEDLDSEELKTMKSSLGKFSAYPEDEVSVMVELGVKNFQDIYSHHYHYFINPLNKHLKKSAKIEVLKVLFHLAGADGIFQNEEFEEIKQVAQDLGLSREIYQSAKTEIFRDLNILE